MSRFRLQSVLDYRRITEGQAQQRYAACLQAESALLGKLNDQRVALESLYSGLDQKKSEGISIDELLLYEGRISLLVKVLAEMAEELERARELVLARKQDLLEASREKKLMEKLKEKHLREEAGEFRRRENIFLDEIAVQRKKG